MYNITLLAAIAILFITLMGLIGYINDELQRRSKEIAIRKVNGPLLIPWPYFVELLLNFYLYLLIQHWNGLLKISDILY